MSTTLTPPRTRPRVDGPDSGVDDTWKVIVLNDAHNTFDYVILTFCSVLPSMNEDKAEKLAWQIHTTGLALVWSGHKERAELYHDQLTDAGLTMAPLEQ